MKRGREDDRCDGPTAVLSYESPLRTVPPRPLWGKSVSMGSAMADITPTKRQRDRTMPMDAMSRLMTAATSAARMRKRAQMTLTSLFGGKAMETPPTVAMGSCAVCVATVTQAKALMPVMQLQRCAHCERTMDTCCSRECEGCASVFCSQCSTINCDEQYDRVFCLSCHYDMSR